jgi:ZIP family zinc transporter
VRRIHPAKPGLVAARVLGGAGHTVPTFVLAVAAAALLWLVVEEVLVEAHQTPQPPWIAAMFFVGFLISYCLDVLE